MSRAAFSVVEVKRAIRAVEAVGKCVTSVRYLVDGGFELLTATPAKDSPSAEPGQWGDDAGEETIHRA